MRTWHEPCTSIRLDRCGIQLAVAHSFNTQLRVVTILDEPDEANPSAVFPPLAQAARWTRESTQTTRTTRARPCP